MFSDLNYVFVVEVVHICKERRLRVSFESNNNAFTGGKEEYFSEILGEFEFQCVYIVITYFD